MRRSHTDIWSVEGVDCGGHGLCAKHGVLGRDAELGGLHGLRGVYGNYQR
jgi:hypothetical protein